MTISHHPGEELLLDYAAGSLAEPWSLAVAAHLALCPTCRQEVAEMEAFGGQLMSAVAPVPVNRDLYESIVAATNAVVEDDVPVGYYTYARSSISKTPLLLANNVGIIDSGYRGNLIAMFRNLESDDYTIAKQTRMIQICHSTLKLLFVV